jgi:hypothetical protein
MLYCPYGSAADCPNALPGLYRGFWERPVDEAEHQALMTDMRKIAMLGKEYDENHGIIFAVPKEAPQ